MFGGPTLFLFRARGIPVGAHWSLFVALALMGFAYGGRTSPVVDGLAGVDVWAWLSGVALAILAFASVLLHEFGHAIVAQRRDVPIVGIDLHLMGGVAKMGGPPKSPGDEIAIAIAGPLVSLALGAVLLGVAAWLRTAGFEIGTTPAELAGWLGGLNLAVGVFNLLPALPMDGGRVARAWFSRKVGLVKGTERAVWLSRALAFGIALLGLFTNLWLLVIAAFIVWMGREELAAVREHAALHKWGFRDEAFDPWAKYHRSADRSRGVREQGPHIDAPQILVRGPNGDVVKTSSPESAQRFVQDIDGKWIVVSEPARPVTS